MSDTNETLDANPNDGDLQQESEVDLADLVDEEGDSAEPENDASDEFDLDGQKLSKKEVKELLAKKSALAEKEANMQKDYTQKTMALAEVRKNAEALAMQREETLKNIGEFHAQAKQELEEFHRIDWEKVAQQDPENFPAMYALAQSRAQQRQYQVQQAEQAAMQLSDQRAQEEWAQLTQAIPELGDPVKGATISRDIETVLQHFGITHIPDHKVGVMVAKMLPLLEKAAKYDDLLKRKAEKTRSNASSNAPEPPVSTKAVSSSSNRLDDNLPIDEWVKRRNAQLKRR
jgi:hypothetical protein